MEKLDNVKYEKLNFDNYTKRINELSKNKNLLKLGLEKKRLTSTEYNYDIDCISVGYGPHELFIVAGTHGSEIIGVDFVTQLLERIDTLEEFDPNFFKINVIPLQNPEGFDITTSMLNGINNNNFEKSAYEYYLRYRTDSIIGNAIGELNKFMNGLINSERVITANEFLTSFKVFVNSNAKFKALEDKRAIPNIVIFNNLLKSISDVSNFNDLKIKLLGICNITISKLELNNINDSFLKIFIEQLRNAFGKEDLWNSIEKENQVKLYQQMFDKCRVKNLRCKRMEFDIDKMYKIHKHPNGSQVGYDATGIGINLNANNKLNPGIKATKEGNIIWGPGVKNNIKNYFPGPLGTPSKGVYNFEYAIENKALFKLLNDSYQNGTYLATLLYHGTGGLIYYKPCLNLMDEKQYNLYYEYNRDIASVYNRATDYKILEESSTTGYGDLLRRTFPGVILIELSKMGGNPIGPYGDSNNIYVTFEDNFKAVNNLLKNFKKLERKPKCKAK